jgi:hypothetical protein
MFLKDQLMTDEKRNLYEVKKEFKDVAEELIKKSGITAEDLLADLTRKQVRVVNHF